MFSLNVLFSSADILGDILGKVKANKIVDQSSNMFHICQVIVLVPHIFQPGIARWFLCLAIIATGWEPTIPVVCFAPTDPEENVEIHLKLKVFMKMFSSGKLFLCRGGKE